MTTRSGEPRIVAVACAPADHTVDLFLETNADIAYLGAETHRMLLPHGRQFRIKRAQVFVDEPAEYPQSFAYRREIEQFQQQPPVISFGLTGQQRAVRPVFRGVIRKRADGRIADHATRVERGAQHQPFQTLAATERHVHLPCEKESAASITARSNVSPWLLWIVMAHAAFSGY